MSKKTKIWLIVATSLVVLGLIIFAAVMSAYNWDFTKLSTTKYQTNTYEISKDFDAISINTNTADILFATSDDKTCRVVCYEQENIKHSVDVQAGALNINVVDERKWYEYIGVNFGTQKITVYLPKSEYASLFIKTSTGDISVKSISAGEIDLSVSTGNVTVSNVSCEGDIKINVSTGKTNITDAKCKNVISSGSTGDLSLKNVIATKKFSIERDTGDVKFDKADAAEIFVKTDTGDVTGTLLTEKVFITQTDTGNINIPKTVTGGKCEITTDTGDIKIAID